MNGTMKLMPNAAVAGQCVEHWRQYRRRQRQPGYIACAPVAATANGSRADAATLPIGAS